jgi:hypothetical protein
MNFSPMVHLLVVRSSTSRDSSRRLMGRDARSISCWSSGLYERDYPHLKSCCMGRPDDRRKAGLRPGSSSGPGSGRTAVFDRLTSEADRIEQFDVLELP